MPKIAEMHPNRLERVVLTFERAVFRRKVSQLGHAIGDLDFPLHTPRALFTRTEKGFLARLEKAADCERGTYDTDDSYL